MCWMEDLLQGLMVWCCNIVLTRTVLTRNTSSSSQSLWHVKPFQSLFPLCAPAKFCYPGCTALDTFFSFFSLFFCFVLKSPPITPQSILWKTGCSNKGWARHSMWLWSGVCRQTVLEDSAAVQVDFASVEASQIKTERENRFAVCLPWKMPRRSTDCRHFSPHVQSVFVFTLFHNKLQLFPI